MSDAPSSPPSPPFNRDVAQNVNFVLREVNYLRNYTTCIACAGRLSDPRRSAVCPHTLCGRCAAAAPPACPVRGCGLPMRPADLAAPNHQVACIVDAVERLDAAVAKRRLRCIPERDIAPCEEDWFEDGGAQEEWTQGDALAARRVPDEMEVEAAEGKGEGAVFEESEGGVVVQSREDQQRLSPAAPVDATGAVAKESDAVSDGEAAAAVSAHEVDRGVLPELPGVSSNIVESRVMHGAQMSSAPDPEREKKAVRADHLTDLVVGSGGGHRSVHPGIDRDAERGEIESAPRNMLRDLAPGGTNAEALAVVTNRMIENTPEASAGADLHVDVRQEGDRGSAQLCRSREEEAKGSGEGDALANVGVDRDAGLNVDGVEAYVAGNTGRGASLDDVAVGPEAGGDVGGHSGAAGGSQPSVKFLERVNEIEDTQADVETLPPPSARVTQGVPESCGVVDSNVDAGFGGVATDLVGRIRGEENSPGANGKLAAPLLQQAGGAAPACAGFGFLPLVDESLLDAVTQPPPLMPPPLMPPPLMPPPLPPSVLMTQGVQESCGVVDEKAGVSVVGSDMRDAMVNGEDSPGASGKLPAGAIEQMGGVETGCAAIGAPLHIDESQRDAVTQPPPLMPAPLPLPPSVQAAEDVGPSPGRFNRVDSLLAAPQEIPGRSSDVFAESEPAERVGAIQLGPFTTPIAHLERDCPGMGTVVDDGLHVCTPSPSSSTVLRERVESRRMRDAAAAVQGGETVVCTSQLPLSKRQLCDDFCRSFSLRYVRGFVEHDCPTVVVTPLQEDGRVGVHSFNNLNAMLAGIPIVGTNWLTSCDEAGALLPYDRFLSTSRCSKTDGTLFSDLVACVDAMGSATSANEMAFLIRLGGGRVLPTEEFDALGASAARVRVRVLGRTPDSQTSYAGSGSPSYGESDVRLDVDLNFFVHCIEHGQCPPPREAIFETLRD